MNAPVKLRPDQPAEIVDPLALMRAPFPENQISKLPKPLAKREEMDKLPKAKCAECGGYHATSKVIHLDYVGHAALTDRLLDADPRWNWEPVADPVSLGLPTAPGGMWIKLTVDGVTRLGFGHPDGKSGGDAVKETIGDALRNAAMRFGAALDLWHKGDLHAPDSEGDAGSKDRDDGPSAIFIACKAAIDICDGEDALNRWKADNAKAFAQMSDPDLTAIKRYWQGKVKEARANPKPKEDFGIDPEEIPF